ncbi:hypothetical protein [Tenacibaculum agarivorans]|uniref:hypothetical protein n=1 Tax=Tenacibaculum agarivorans TaxID=1908389 RepID=UPI00094BA58F|nr:hypothetical protein [Tenacibaculum agarivorans]
MFFTTKKENQVKVDGVTMNLLDFRKVGSLPATQCTIPSGPLTNSMGPYKFDNKEIYVVTVLAYIPDNELETKVKDKSGLVLIKDKLYLNYKGVKDVTIILADGKQQELTSRNFVVEYDCDENTDNYIIYQIRFAYNLDEGTDPVDVIFVQDKDDDPETDRGTVTTPAKDDE